MLSAMSVLDAFNLVQFLFVVFTKENYHWQDLDIKKIVHFIDKEQSVNESCIDCQLVFLRVKLFVKCFWSFNLYYFVHYSTQLGSGCQIRHAEMQSHADIVCGNSLGLWKYFVVPHFCSYQQGKYFTLVERKLKLWLTLF